MRTKDSTKPKNIGTNPRPSQADSEVQNGSVDEQKINGQNAKV
jgi:hypothetical protein